MGQFYKDYLKAVDGVLEEVILDYLKKATDMLTRKYQSELGRRGRVWVEVNPSRLIWARVVEGRYDDKSKPVQLSQQVSVTWDAPDPNLIEFIFNKGGPLKKTEFFAYDIKKFDLQDFIDLFDHYAYQSKVMDEIYRQDFDHWNVL